MKMFRCLMPLRYTTLRHQDGLWEGDAANGASARSQSQSNAGVQPVVCADNSSAMVNHVSNSGAIVKPTITTYMHIVLMEVLVTIMNCIPKQAGDHEAVDAVARQRETIIRTAADTEVLLPFVQDPDQASTAAPPDDKQDICLDVRRRSAWMMNS